MTLDSDGALASGMTLLVSASSIHESEASARRIARQAFDVLLRGRRLSVSVCNLGEGAAAHAALSAVCRLLRLAMDRAGTPPGSIELVVGADVLPAQTIWVLRRQWLGIGPVHFLPGTALMPSGRTCGGSRQAHFWPQLWQASAHGPVRAAFSTRVFPQCSLLSTEAATAIVPDMAIQVPVETAWVPMCLDISRFAADDGSLRESAVEHALCRCVEIGDALHDLTRWPTAKMRHDAWLNRRLAIIVTGIGDLVQRRRQDPKLFSSLKELCELLRWIKNVLHRQSQAMARATGKLPALDLSDPSRGLPCGPVRDGWHARWREAVNLAAVRHRNLLVLSPWSLFPSNQPPDYSYTDLLPLLEFANASASCGRPELAHWDVCRFKNFHQRAWAVLQQRDAAHQIAERL
ncbi:MAG: hypothetical protein OEM51_03315 [Gammaproteobacteria bacterium]|nr:hypothetical protein [Gammaproteobacteria bacterium]